ncbi:MAG: N-acetylmuramoyl-L-alanine amidase, partial [Albidovulum sp.]
APTRKSDPGPKFDWRRLARQGVAVWPEAEGDDEADFGTSARAFGYPDAPAEALLTAFRLRFRPWAQGAEVSLDRSQAAWLASQRSKHNTG